MSALIVRGPCASGTRKGAPLADGATMIGLVSYRREPFILLLIVVVGAAMSALLQTFCELLKLSDAYNVQHDN